MDVNVEVLRKMAGKWANKRFGHLPDRKDWFADVESVAWELAILAPENTSYGAIIRFAAMRVATRRQFSEKASCLETIPKEKRASRNEFRRVTFDPKVFASMRDNPAEIAIFRIDFPAWLESLKPKHRQVAEMLLIGETNGTIAIRLQVSPSRVSQICGELAESWTLAHS